MEENLGFTNGQLLPARSVPENIVRPVNHVRPSDFRPITPPRDEGQKIRAAKNRRMLAQQQQQQQQQQQNHHLNDLNDNN
uniref:Uncharacterized protein n=1 Tax=Meloidogyne enterolobii TaxID=390850 RepID=A0A6V7VVX1_MELEN|nr:unnamed protein product [Meloidogyne enterolobii]